MEDSNKVNEINMNEIVLMSATTSLERLKNEERLDLLMDDDGDDIIVTEVIPKIAYILLEEMIKNAGISNVSITLNRSQLDKLFLKQPLSYDEWLEKTGADSEKSELEYNNYKTYMEKK